MNITLAIVGVLLIAVAGIRGAMAENAKILAKMKAAEIQPEAPKPEADPKVEEPSLADKIQSLGDTWESQRKATQDFHDKNYRKQYAIIAGLMERLGEENITVGNKFPEGLTVWMTEPEPGKVEITIERR